MKHSSYTVIAAIVLLASTSWAADRQMMVQPGSAPAMAPPPAGIPIPIPETAQPLTPRPSPAATPIHLPKLPENPATPPGVPVPYPNTGALRPVPAMK